MVRTSGFQPADLGSIPNESRCGKLRDFHAVCIGQLLG